MPWLRIALERVLLGLFRLARSACFAFALAMAGALLAAPWVVQSDAPRWLASTVRSCLGIGSISLATGVLLIGVRHLRSPGVEAAAEPDGPGPLVLGLSLAALAALACAGASDLLPLWREILSLLERMGLWEVLRRADPYGGLVVFPILAALFVPALEALAAFFLCAVPLALLGLLATRSRLLPRLFAMTVVCQAGLVLAGLIAAAAFARLATAASAAMAADPAAELQLAAEELGQAQAVLGSVAAACVTPLLGYLVAAVVAWRSRRLAAYLTAGPLGPAVRTPAPAEPLLARPSTRLAVRPLAAVDGAPRALPIRFSERRARVAFLALGALLLAFAATAGREVGERRLRHTFVGGAMLVALGALLPRLPRKR